MEIISDEILVEIVRNLNLSDLRRFRQVNQRFRNIADYIFSRTELPWRMVLDYNNYVLNGWTKLGYFPNTFQVQYRHQEKYTGKFQSVRTGRGGSIAKKLWLGYPTVKILHKKNLPVDIVKKSNSGGEPADVELGNLEPSEVFNFDDGHFPVNRNNSLVIYRKN